MFNLDPGKLLIVGVVAILLLGPDRLPKVARQVGDTWRSFNEFRQRMEAEVRSTMPDLPSTTDIARLARSPSALLDNLANMTSDQDRNAAHPGPQEGDVTALPASTAGATPGGEMSWVTADFSAAADADAATTSRDSSPLAPAHKSNPPEPEQSLAPTNFDASLN